MRATLKLSSIVVFKSTKASLLCRDEKSLGAEMKYTFQGDEMALFTMQARISMLAFHHLSPSKQYLLLFSMNVHYFSSV